MGPYRVGHNDQCRRVEILSGSPRNTGRIVERTPLNEIPTCSSRAWGIMASAGRRRRSTGPIMSALTLSRFKRCHSTRTGSLLTSPLAARDLAFLPRFLSYILSNTMRARSLSPATRWPVPGNRWRQRYTFRNPSSSQSHFVVEIKRSIIAHNYIVSGVFFSLTIAYFWI